MGQKMQNAPFKFKPKDWFAFFREHRWDSKEIRYLAEEGDRLQRPIQLPPLFRVVLRIRRLFISSERQAAFRKAASYVLLRPA